MSKKLGVVLLVTLILALALPSRGKADGGKSNNYAIPEYQYYCFSYCYEYITDHGVVTEIINQNGSNEITIVSWKHRTLNIYYAGSLVQSEASTNFHMVNKETLRNSIFKYSDNVAFTDYLNNLTCEIDFDIVEKIVNGEHSLVFDHGNENCEPIQ